MKLSAIAAIVLVAAASANALTASYGWEDGGTVLGSFGTVLAENVGAPDPVYAGNRSLKLVDNNSGSGTPQAYVAWIQGLQDGDVVTGSFWIHDTTPSGSPSGRIWGHWNDTTDITGYNGSASGSSDYGPGDGWAQLSYSWTVAGGHTGLVIEARTYSNGTDTVWIDDLSIQAPDHASVVIPTPEPASLALLLVGGLFLSRRR